MICYARSMFLRGVGYTQEGSFLPMVEYVDIDLIGD